MFNKLLFPAKWLISFVSEILQAKIMETEETISKLEAMEKRGKKWRKAYRLYAKHLRQLDFWLKATPAIIYVGYTVFATLFILVASGQIFSWVISQIVTLTISTPLPITIGIYMVIIVLLFAFIAAGYSWILRLFNMPLMDTDYASMYEQVLETADIAVDAVVCNKVGLYSPQSPSDMRPVSLEWEVVNNVPLFYVEFNKYRDIETADEELFKRLFEKNLKRLRKERKLPIAFADRVGIRGKVYEPLLVMHTRQNRDSLIVAIAFADEDSVTMLINSQSSNRSGGELFDDE